MLKIKDNVDLKELEKFGFKKFPLIYVKEIAKNSTDIFFTRKIYVDEQNRKISISEGIFNIDIELNPIYDLIKADLVEKVEEDDEFNI